MKAIFFSRYGSPDAIELREAEKPLLQDHQLLIRVKAASINALDRHALYSQPPMLRIVSGNGLFKPKDQRLGADIAGIVEEVGRTAQGFQPGDAVFGVCSGGGLAEYACARADRVIVKPAALTFETAAAMPVAAITALQGLRDTGHLQPGQKVLIDGASGGVGTFAVQIARAFGAEVTATCSARNLDLVRSLGAEHVIDYGRQDFTRLGERYDLVLEVNGYHSILAYRRALSPQGTYVLAGGPAAKILPTILQVAALGPLLSRSGGQQIKFMGIAQITQPDLNFIKDMILEGKVKPAIDRTYPLSQTAEAFRYLESEHAQGKVVISLEARQ